MQIADIKVLSLEDIKGYIERDCFQNQQWYGDDTYWVLDLGTDTMYRELRAWCENRSRKTEYHKTLFYHSIPNGKWFVGLIDK
ncbi:MAG: hypothetical protein Q8Q03_00490 [bacterium]|nr:hypothetical protein [bacterium]